MSGWWGVDLDATLAHYEGFKGAGHIGAPIMRTVRRVKYWLNKGRDVRIFTARVHHPRPQEHESEASFNKALEEKYVAESAIQDFCRIQFGRLLPVTCEKDYHMVSLLDDRVEQAIPNTGKLVRHELRMAVEALQKIASYADPGKSYFVAQDALANLDQWSLDLVKSSD